MGFGLFERTTERTFARRGLLHSLMFLAFTVVSWPMENVNFWGGGVFEKTFRHLVCIKERGNVSRKFVGEQVVLFAEHVRSQCDSRNVVQHHGRVRRSATTGLKCIPLSSTLVCSRFLESESDIYHILTKWDCAFAGVSIERCKTKGMRVPLYSHTIVCLRSRLVFKLLSLGTFIH